LLSSFIRPSRQNCIRSLCAGRPPGVPVSQAMMRHLVTLQPDTHIDEKCFWRPDRGSFPSSTAADVSSASSNFAWNSPSPNCAPTPCASPKAAHGHRRISLCRRNDDHIPDIHVLRRIVRVGLSSDRATNTPSYLPPRDAPTRTARSSHPGGLITCW
jgi:hypothetical protein